MDIALLSLSVTSFVVTGQAPSPQWLKLRLRLHGGPAGVCFRNRQAW